MEHAPENLQNLVDNIAKAETAADIKSTLLPLLRSVEELFAQPIATPDQIYPGTCEEMISNWRNKMYIAAESNDHWLALSSMASLDAMLKELGFHWNILDRFQPDDLAASAKAYDGIIADYRKEYEKAGIPFQSYPDVDAFAEAYLK